MTITKRSGKKFKVLFDAEKLSIIENHTWIINAQGYAATRVFDDRYKHKQRTIMMHWVAFGRKPTKGMHLDHISGVRTDNRSLNIRECTPSQNHQNRRPQGKTSKYKGVTWMKSHNSWRVGIRVDGHLICLGNFKDEQKAALAYDEGAKKYFGDYAYLNFKNK